MDYISSKQAAEKWNISANRITILCKEGRIAGAIQIGTRWFIPKDINKPQDKRFKKAKKETAGYPPFRFFINDSRSSDEYNPPLTDEEIRIKNAYDYFQRCEFSKTKEELYSVNLNSGNKYNRIYTLFGMCVINVVFNETKKFLENYEKLTAELQDEFPRKKELSTLSHELDGILGATQYYISDMAIDPDYSYHESYLPHLTYLAIISLLFSNNSFKTKDLLAYEIACTGLEKSSYLIDAQTLHIYLGIIYALMNKKSEMISHITKGLELGKAHKLYWLPALSMFYYKEIIGPVLMSFPKDFSDKIISLSADIKKRFAAFMKGASGNNLYSILLSNDYPYIFYALQGYSNKEIAGILGTTESTVNNKYSAIYEKLNIFSKKELIAYYLKSNTNSIFKS